MAESGLKAVFLQNRAALLRLLVARLGADEAEDALQDMWFRIDSLAGAPVAQPAAFLFRVAANLATDRRIAARRRVGREGAWLEVQPAADEQPDAERALIARDGLRAMERVIADMPERMRDALRMFRFEERPQREIAVELGITVSGVEKLLRRAYAQITAASADGAPPHRLSGEGAETP